METREIKFRAWDQDRKQMVYKFSEKLNSKAYVLFWSEDNERLFCGNYMDNGDWQEPKLMQATGLFDKNRNMIYEGDVISIELEDVTKRGVVKFDPLRGIWEPYLEGSNEFWYTFQQLATDFGAYVTVIGNTFENPELY